MGQSPQIPDLLSDEGKDFLGKCFVHLPEDRASAQDLLSHNFTKVTLKKIEMVNFFQFRFFMKMRIHPSLCLRQCLTSVKQESLYEKKQFKKLIFVFHGVMFLLLVK